MSITLFIHALKANAQEGSVKLRKAPEMKQCILTYSHDNEISCDIVVLSS